jgi:hypothetical protein
MDLSSQPSSSEESERHHHSEEEETLLQSSPAAASLPEEPEHVDPVAEDVPAQAATASGPEHVDPIAEDVLTQPATAPEVLAEETEQHVDPITEDVPNQPALASEQLAEETEQQPTSPFDPAGDEVLDEEVFDEDEDEDLELEGASPARAGVFISRGVLIAAACAVVVVVLLATLLVVVTRPKDPPTDWIASYTPAPAAGTTSSGKILYYLHWANQNGALQGQLQLATVANGTLQSATAPTTGLYSKDNHIIYVVVTLNGQASTLTGKINDASDTLTLNAPGATGADSGLVFHTGSANDYKQATKKLGSSK